ncbi:MAG: hypothetical protein ABIQ29_01835 [Burkholderiaceae bacterium]
MTSRKTDTVQTDSLGCGLRRRQLLALGALVSAAAPAQAAWAARSIPAAEPLRQIRAGGPSGLLAVGASGALWALSASGAAATKLADGLDPFTPLASGHGRIAARHADGGLWVWQGGPAQRGPRDALAPQAGLLVLPLAVIGVAAGSHRVLRFEPDASQVWAVVARSAEAVLPDARPLQADLDARGDGGHLVLLAGPDSQRYTHGVLGDGVEATRVVWLERHSLALLRELVLPAPDVIEDIAPRWVALGRGSALLTVRSGPQGGQLGLVAASATQPRRLQWAALGEALGSPNRWMAPSTDGTRLLAVHTPHIGGVLHEYRVDGNRLVGRAVANNVSTHRIGSRELDLAVWLGPRVVLPQQNGLALRVLDANAVWAEVATIALPARVAMTAALPGGQDVAALLDDGRVFGVGVA